MMIYVLYAIGFMAYGGLFILFMHLLTEDQIIKGLTVLLVFLTLTIWFLFQVSENKQPCVRYETVMKYNPVTKTAAPMQFCAVEGEWVK